MPPPRRVRPGTTYLPTRRSFLFLVSDHLREVVDEARTGAVEAAHG